MEEVEPSQNNQIVKSFYLFAIFVFVRQEKSSTITISDDNF